MEPFYYFKAVMKATYIFIPLLLFTTLEGLTQKHTETISRIRQEFTRINKDSTLKVITLDAEEFLENTPDGGAELKGFYKNGKLVKLIEWIGLSYGNRIREFYLKDEALFFVYEIFYSFVRTEDGLDPSKTVKSFEARYYISENKLIDKKQTGKVPMDQSQPTASTLIADAEEYSNKLSTVK